jgi:microcin C transport system substrate-binding protein
MALVFDFEWANANLFYGQYRRLNSYFANSELASRGLPEGRELEILQSVRGKVPDDVFTKPFANPVNAKPQDIRDNLRAAAKLLAEAGWQNKAGGVSNAAGERMAVEILLESPAFERIALPYAQALERIGVKATVRLVDAAQYKRRIDTFDYDIIVHTFAQSESPGNEQRDYWSSAAADQQGSRNLTGIKNAGVDALVERLIAASSREDLIAATRALDRVLLTLHLVVPHWYSAADRVAHWDYFGEPKTLPSRSVGFPTVWWWDEARANKIAGAR